MRPIFAVALLLVTAFGCLEEPNPCNRYAELICSCEGEASDDCYDAQMLAVSPSSGIADQCDLCVMQTPAESCPTDDIADCGI